MPFAAAHVRVVLALTGGGACVGGDDQFSDTLRNRINANRNNNASEMRADD